MLKEASDMLFEFNDFEEEAFFTVPDASVRTHNSLAFRESNNVSNPVINQNSFVPMYESENCFAGNLTLSLMRSSSFEFPLERMQIEQSGNNNKDMANLFPNPLEDSFSPEFVDMPLDFPVFEEPKPRVNNSRPVFEVLESCTGKYAPKEEKRAMDIEVSFEQTENRRTLRYSDVRKQKIQKNVPVKRLKKKNERRSTKRSPTNNIRDSKRECKNIVKNYGKAMATFSLSQMAEPFLLQLAEQFEVDIEEFKDFMTNKKETIDSIGSFRYLLSPDPRSDSPQEMRFKAVFRGISEIFVRDFAVNWIFSSKSQYKTALLNYRFKMLRRVRNPDGFTFLKGQ